ncbi:hypothetical protein HDU93_002450 [Gonapodya sp. JEL0774]|nr:hypothetical protein HDU93_002450 [Gonapodya sp. JEL0774]
MCYVRNNNYPFDTYTGYLPAFALFKEKTLYPLGLVIFGDQGPYAYGTNATTYDDKYIELYLSYRRSATTKVFALVIAVIMVRNKPAMRVDFKAYCSTTLQWGVALMYFVATTDVRHNGQPLQSWIVEVGAALLFALPGIRATAPNAPPIGTQYDVAAFFGPVIIVGICFIINFGRVIYEKTADQDASSDETPSDGSTPQRSLGSTSTLYARDSVATAAEPIRGNETVFDPPPLPTIAPPVPPRSRNLMDPPGRSDAWITGSARQSEEGVPLYPRGYTH